MKKIQLAIMIMVLPLIVLGQEAMPREKRAISKDEFSTSSMMTMDSGSWEHAQKMVSGNRIATHLSVLANDDMEGRETGSEGLKKAASYIVKKLNNAGLTPIDEDQDFRQEVLFEKKSWDKTQLTINGKKTKLLRHFYSFTDYFNELKTHYDQVSFLGYGIRDIVLNNYSRNPKAKAGIVFSGQPKDKEGHAIYPQLEEQAYQFYKKGEEAKKAGIETLFIIDDNFKNNAATFNRFILNPRFKMISDDNQYSGANLIWISSQQATEIFGSKIKKVLKRKNKILDKKRFKNFEIPADINLDFEVDDRSIKSANVCALVEGTDKTLQKETIVISAHYDHLGKRGEEIYNGADDNGSGTSTILSIAEAIQAYKDNGGQLKRSILFLFFTGEEKGLLGSQYYTEQPLIPLENTITDLNIDMVGRIDKAHEGDSNYVYVIGSDKLSMDLHHANESMNKQYTQLNLDYTFNDENDPNRFYYRSDHYNFAKNNIPVIFYFSGVHDDYHQPSDTFEKILPEKAARIGQLCFMTALDIANAKKRPQLNQN